MMENGDNTSAFDRIPPPFSLSGIQCVLGGEGGGSGHIYRITIPRVFSS